jgi:hypothetical protein
VHISEIVDKLHGVWYFGFFSLLPAGLRVVCKSLSAAKCKFFIMRSRDESYGGSGH